MVEDKDKPTAKSVAVKAMLPSQVKCRDIDKGWDRIRESTTDYLPRHPKEESANYTIRLNRPVFINFFARTIDGLTGMVFRKDPTLAEDVPEPIVEHWENIDNAGTHGAVFAKTVFREAVLAGHSVIMVDAPEVEGPLNYAQEKARGLRPYWIRYDAEDVYGATTERISGRTVLTRIRLRVVSTEPAGKFGDKEVERVKEFYRDVRTKDGVETVTVGWRLYEKSNDEWKKAKEGVLGGQDEIPVVFIYGKRMAPYVSQPPLEDLANANILHYQTNSDYYHCMHTANVPTLFLKSCGEEGSVTIGPNSILLVDDESADAKWVETSGAALGHTRQALEDVKGEIATLGLNFLSPDKRAAETAESKRIDKAESDSSLSAIARSLEDGLEQCLGYHAKY
ncbi:MAG: DUF4055 domain-containing protein, partial [Planctomycetota bacterium]